MTSIPESLISPEALAEALAARVRAALASGALQPIETVESPLEDAGVRFVVRSVSSLVHKPRAGAGSAANPFLPPEPDLTVGALSATHVAVLNKFPVVERHLLVVTREFVDQETLLDRADFAVLAACLRGVDGLAFYNGGREAGASQPHKHLQLVPLPIGDGPWDVPMEALFDTWVAAGPVARLPRLPFANAFAPLDESAFAKTDAAEGLLERYQGMLAVCSLGANRDEAANEPQRQAGPYNLLMTRRWMLLVPRSRERFGTISVNALGFAGSLFVRDDAELRALREAGPMRLLQAVARPV